MNGEAAVSLAGGPSKDKRGRWIEGGAGGCGKGSASGKRISKQKKKKVKVIGKREMVATGSL